MNDLTAQQAQCSWTDIHDDLVKHFHEASNAKCVLWVNPAQYDPFETNSFVDEYRVRIPIRHPRFDVQRGPYLVPLDLTATAANEILKQSVELACFAWTAENLSAFGGQPIAGWIATRASSQSLAAHWGHHCYIHRHRKLTKLLRFHDPGVREWLWALLDADQRDVLLGLSDSIWGIGRGRVLQHHARSEPLGSGGVTRSLTLQEKQWTQVDDYATVHAAWVSCLNDSNQKQKATAWEQHVFKALDAATRYGITDSLDRELFALHALRLGSGFHTCEEMLPIWQKITDGHYYGNALEDVFHHPADQFHLYFEKLLISASKDKYG